MNIQLIEIFIEVLPHIAVFSYAIYRALTIKNHIEIIALSILCSLVVFGIALEISLVITDSMLSALQAS